MISPEDTAITDNPKYRQYHNTVEKALKSFESSSEWADLISALGKLNKILNPKCPVIPKKITIGKRLAQCMHPALPGGVHLKALEVYNTIFKIIETERLKTDLHIYTMGIFPLLVNASMQVRPVLLNLYETHFLPLEETLRICLDGMLLGLLPGLEEGTEHFERADVLLESVCEKVGRLDFYGAVWRCVLSSSSVRLAAVQLILRRFDRKKSTDDQLYIIGSDIDVMVLALRESLQDSSVLTQRASLDVLILCCPLSNFPISRQDCRQLLLASLQCILRRDMSLNRRLYSWLLGHDLAKRLLSSSSFDLKEEESYFDKFAKQLLIEAIVDILVSQKNKLVNSANIEQISVSEELYPFRLIISLLDKPEIGPVIIEAVLIDVFRLLKAAVTRVKLKNHNETNTLDVKSDSQNTGIVEISKTANLLLGVFEPGYIWQFFSQLLRNSTRNLNANEEKPSENSASYSEVCNFICLLLEIVNLDAYQEVKTFHLPSLLYDLISSMDEFISELSEDELKLGLKTSDLLLDLTQPSQQLGNGFAGATAKKALMQEVKANSLNGEVFSDATAYHDVIDCSTIFCRLFCNIVLTKLSCNTVSIECCMSELSCVETQRDNKVSEARGNERQVVGSNNHPGDPESLDDDMKHLIEIFGLACRLLADFACFPIYYNGNSYLSGYKDDRNEQSSFPTWMQCLLWCACNTSLTFPSCFQIASSSLSTLLDLMALASSVSRNKTPVHDKEEPCVGRVSVDVLSPMASSHVSMLTEGTSFFQLVTKKLWKVLGDESLCDHHLTSVQHLTRLHTMCSDARCEDVLLEDIMHPNKEIRIKSLSKFCRLWNLTRALLTKKVASQTDTGPFRNFNRCLFAACDSLSYCGYTNRFLSPLFQRDVGGNSVSMSIASSWLHQCLEERDLVRILEPFLLVALHPRTHSSLISHSVVDDVSFSERNTTVVLKSTSGKHVVNSKLSERLESDDTPDVNHSFTLSVITDILKGKELYKELISNLTCMNGVDKEEQLRLHANQIVDDVIEKSVRVLKSDSSEDTKDPYFPLSDVEEPSEEATTTSDSDDEQEDGSSSPAKKASRLDSTTHMLIYQEHFDTPRSLYALRSIFTLLQTHPKLFTYSAMTSQLSAHTSQLSAGGILQDLIARHLQVLHGRSFYDDVISRSPNTMMVGVLIVLCLHYIRSWHPDDVIPPESIHDIRCAASSLLEGLLREMTDLLRESATSSTGATSPPTASSTTSQQFGPFVRSLLSKHNVIEIVLTSLSTTVQALHIKEKNPDDFMCEEEHHIITSRSSLNALDEVELAFWWSGNSFTRINSFQKHLLALVRSLVVLEHHLVAHESYSKSGDSMDVKEKQLLDPIYHTDLTVAMQPLFSTSLIQVLRLQSSSDLHSLWLDLLTSSMTYMTKALSSLATPVTFQLCKNLEIAASFYANWTTEKSSSLKQMPAGYLITLLKSLRSLTHFTLLLQSSSGLQHPVFNTASQQNRSDRTGSPNSNSVTSQTSSNAGFLTLGSLFNVFTNSTSIKSQRSIEEQVLPGDWIEARRATLRNLPRILACLAMVWDQVVFSSSTSNSSSKKSRKTVERMNPCIVMGDSESVAQSILQILNPLALQYGENLLCALAVVWERRARLSSKLQDDLASRELSHSQSQLFNVACGIRALHCDVTLGLVKRVIVQPPELPSTLSTKRQKVPFEESLLDFSLRFLQRQTISALRESWPSLLSLLRECVSLGPVANQASSNSTGLASGLNTTIGGKRVLSPRCYFLLLLLVAEYVKRIPTFEDKKDQKDLQDICIKCIEACNSIVDRSLEHGGWLARRAPSVLPRPQLSNLKSAASKQNVEANSSAERLDLQQKDKEELHLKTVASDPVLPSPKDRPNALPLSMAVLPKNQHYHSSVQALTVLAQVLANLLDVIYGSEEKEKTVPVLIPVMTNVIPFLRTHSLKNAPSYRAAVSLLSSVSGYQHTRRAWKRDAFDLFLAPDFFQMPVDSVSEWRNVVDHLMTHDSTTFKDLMIRIGMTKNAATGTSLNIFSNRDQELEQRAMLLKRLAFVVFSSDLNQYQRHLPEIQERLSESLRLHQFPVVQEQVFLCFRVLLLRVAPTHLTSLWPSIITELVQVIEQMEQNLAYSDLDESVTGNSGISPKAKSNSGTPTSGIGILFNAVNSTSGTQLQEKWMATYLSACKLLDLALSLQPHQLVHFKMFRWSFVGEPGEGMDDDEIMTSSKVERNNLVDKNVANDEVKRSFIPHCVRIKRILAEKHPSGKNEKIDVSPLRPLLAMRYMTSLTQLQPFFNTIIHSNTMLSMHRRKLVSPHHISEESSYNNSEIEKLLERDFVDQMT